MAQADGSVNIRIGADASDAEKKLKSINNKIQNLKENIDKLSNKKLTLTKQLEELMPELDAAKVKLNELVAEKADKSVIADQRERVRLLQQEFNSTETAITRIDTKLAESNVEMQRLTGNAADLQGELAGVSKSTNGMSRAMESFDAKVKKVERRIIGLAKRVFFFSLITRAFSGVRSWFWDIINTSAEATAAIAKLKGALLTLAQPIIEVIIPAFVKFVNVLAAVITAIAAFISGLFGKTLAQSKSAAKALNSETKAIKGTGAAAEKAKKQLAAFDEINQLTAENAAGGGGGGGGIEPDFDLDEGLISKLAGIGQKIGNITERIKQDLAALEYYAGTALLALGLILTLTGANIPLGLGLIVAGCLMMAHSQTLNWGKVSQNTLEALNEIMVFASLSLMAIGLILAFSGANIPLGLAMIVAGAVIAASVALNWNKLSEDVKEKVRDLTGFMGIAFLALGAILTFTGVNIPLGLALLALGSATLAAAFKPEWNAFKQKVREITQDVKEKVNLYVITPLNKVLDLLNKIFGTNWSLGASVHISTDGTTHGGGGSSFGRSVPGLATGSVVPPNREFMALLGDNKRETEVVSPLSTMKQAMIEALRESGGAGGNQSIKVYLDGKQIAQNQVKYMRDIERSRG